MGKVFILHPLGRVGGPAEITPIFLNELRSAKTPGFEMYIAVTCVAQDYVMHCHDPSAVDYLLEQLTSSNADHVAQEEAYTHVAGTGGRRSAQAVMQLRRRRALLCTLTDEVVERLINAGEFGGRTKVVAEKDRAGRH